SPAIRAWNRISIFIGFGAVALLLIFVQNALSKASAGGKRKFLQPFVCVFLICLAVLDQMAPRVHNSREYYKTAFLNDKEFIAEIENQLAAGSAIYQLPYIGFPEVAPIQQLGSYDPLVGFLHSRTLRWSSGGMKGRPGDLFFRALAKEQV